MTLSRCLASLLLAAALVVLQAAPGEARVLAALRAVESAAAAAGEADEPAADEPAADQPQVNPTSDHPERLLLLRDHGAGAVADERQKYYDICRENIPQVEEALREFEELAGEQRWKDIKPLELGKVYVQYEVAQRAPDRLDAMDEIAGADFKKRGELLYTRLRLLIDAYTKSEAGSAALAKGLPTLQKRGKAAAKKDAPRVKKLVDDEQWEEADEVLFAALDELDTMACFFHPNNWTHRDLSQYRRGIEDQMKRLVAQRAGEAVRAARDGQAPDFAGLVARAQQAAAAVGQSGQAEHGGQMLAGPDLLEGLADEWRPLQAAAMRSYALFWVEESLLKAADDPQKLVENQHRFSADMTAALAAIVAADAARATPAEAETLYPRYLAAAARVLALANTPALKEALDPPLETLAAKSPQLSSDIAAYRAATDDVLRWRKLVMQAHSRRLEATFPKLATRFSVLSGNNGSLFKITPGGHDVGGGMNLGVPLPEVMGLMTPALVGQQVSVPGVVEAATFDDVPHSANFGSVWARSPLRDALLGPSQAVARTLLADGAGPLTLPAAIALDDATHGGHLTVGGTISGYEVCGVVARWSRLAPSDVGLVRLGPLAEGDIDLRAGRRVYFGFAVEPAWILHDCFFISLQ
jgi:hypothetical protein